MTGREAPPLPEPAEDSADAKPKRLPLWRILLAVLSGAGAIALFIQAMGVADLSALVQEGGLEFRNLHLEITESAYTEDARQIISTVKGLRETGFVIEMSDVKMNGTARMIRTSYACLFSCFENVLQYK